ncbi:hypothetical protein F4779DRAFT_603195 [Xylariaceae sp. FL0662B]|nr:hypothetical protein F4779DRAFT_603195 [Xylariaceae sp. FL0662B]
MCFQDYNIYKCGCVNKGEFHQRDEKYEAQSNLQCDHPERRNKPSRNYCAKHLVKEDKAKDEFRGRIPRRN